MTGLAPAPGLWRELAGWGLAAATAALPLSLALVWLGGQSGQRDGQEVALMAELATPPAMAVVAAAPPAPPALPDLPEPAPLNLPEPMPQAPVQAEAVLPAPPEAAQPVLPAAEAAQPVAQAEQAVPPATRPKARPQRAAEAAAAAAPPVSGASAAAKPATEVAARAGDDTLQAGWGAAIRKKIERRKAYPKAAAGAAGRVILRMTVAQNGRLLALVLAGPSGNAALDRAALAAVERAGRLPAAPKGLQLDQHVFTLPMDFSP